MAAILIISYYVYIYLYLIICKSIYFYSSMSISKSQYIYIYLHIYIYICIYISVPIYIDTSIKIHQTLDTLVQSHWNPSRSLGHPRRFRKCFTASRKSSPHSITMRGFLTSDDAQNEPNVNNWICVLGDATCNWRHYKKKTGKMMMSCHNFEEV